MIIFRKAFVAMSKTSEAEKVLNLSLSNVNLTLDKTDLKQSLEQKDNNVSLLQQLHNIEHDLQGDSCCVVVNKEANKNDTVNTENEKKQDGEEFSKIDNVVMKENTSVQKSTAKNAENDLLKSSKLVSQFNTLRTQQTLKIFGISRLKEMIMRKKTMNQLNLSNKKVHCEIGDEKFSDSLNSVTKDKEIQNKAEQSLNLLLKYIFFFN